MKTEKTIAIFFLVAVFMKLMHWPGGGILMILSMSICAMLYFPGAFYFFSDKNIRNQNVPLSIVSGFFLSVVPIGILFKVQFWPGANLNLLVGFSMAILFALITMGLRRNAKEELKFYYKNMVTRTVVLALLGGIFYVTPTGTMVSIIYRGDPEEIRLKTQHFENPDNEEYWHQLDEYMQKKDSIRFQELNEMDE